MVFAIFLEKNLIFLLEPIQEPEEEGIAGVLYRWYRVIPNKERLSGSEYNTNKCDFAEYGARLVESKWGS